MIICSKSFENNGMLPQKHTGFGEDVSPEFTITDQPENTVSIAISLDDLDVPFCKSFNHWIIWNIPNTDLIVITCRAAVPVTTDIPVHRTTPEIFFV